MTTALCAIPAAVAAPQVRIGSFGIRLVRDIARIAVAPPLRSQAAAACSSQPRPD